MTLGPLTAHTIQLLLIVSILFAFKMAFAEPPLEDPRFALCRPDPELPVRPYLELKGYEPGTTQISADEVEAVEEGVSTLRGTVELARDQQALRADMLTYDSNKEMVEARGNVQVWEKALFWWGTYASLDLKNDVSRFEQGEYRLLERRGRGKARLVKHDIEEEITRLRVVEYTTCDSEPADWKLAVDYLKLDHREQWGQARHVVLRVRDIPVFYFPYISFPISDKRKSGFLPPTVGNSTKSGIDISLPYYWNIAPERDATFIPRFLGDRGVMLGGQYRYLMRSGRGQLDVEYLPNDRAFEDGDRSLFAFNHQQRFAQGRGNAYVTFTQVSDKEYFEDFGTSLSLTSKVFLEQRADVSYSGNFWSALGRLQGYQTVDRTLPGSAQPYNRLPQVLFHAYVPGGYRGLNLQFLAETVYFDRAQGPTGSRIDLRPVVSFPLYTPATFLIPRLSLRHTQYFLDNVGTASNNLSRTLPIFSVDSGIFLERGLEFGRASYLQTLEPRLFYLYIPHTDQDQLPIFDTGQYDLSFFQLFREERFSGPDRVGDANQVTLALSSRFINRDTGLEHLRTSVGQIIHFQDREVTLPGQSVATETFSEVVAELTTRLSQAWLMRADLIWDPNEVELQKGAVGLRYHPDPYTVFNAEYRRRQDVIGFGPTGFGPAEVEQTDVSFRWPFTLNWSLVGRWNYSIRTGETLEAVGGIEYNSCCWGISAVARRFLSSTAGQFDTTFYLQLELKGLAGFGKRTTSFLKQSIPGYQHKF